MNHNNQRLYNIELYRGLNSSAIKSVTVSVLEKQGCKCQNCTYYYIPHSLCILKSRKKVEWYNICDKHKLVTGRT